MSYSNHPIFQRRRRLALAWTIIALALPFTVWVIYDFTASSAAVEGARVGWIGVTTAFMGALIARLIVLTVKLAGTWRTPAEAEYACASADLLFSDNVVADIEAAEPVASVPTE